MVSPTETMLMSVHPEFAQMIMSGEKTVELRRTRPRMGSGGEVVVYASSPTMALVGTFEIGEVIEASPASLWRKVKTFAGVSKRAFDDYFAGASDGYGIVVRNPKSLPAFVSLERLRRKIPGFHPPQSYRYFQKAELRVLIGM